MFEAAVFYWESYRNGKGGPSNYFFGEANRKVGVWRVMRHLSEDETRRDGSNPFIVLLSKNPYSVCETMSQMLFSCTFLTESSFENA